MADFPPVASLRSFEAVARLGSVTQAAHEMSVTHSAVSQHIKQLEALVGVTLFIRHGRGVRLTEEGRLYALQIREALQHIADATRMVQIKPRTLEVSLATLPSFGCHWLLPRLARFQARHPQIAVRLLTSLAVVNLQQEGIDLAIRMGQGDWEGMESRRLFADEQLVVAAPGYRGGNLPTTPQAIAASDIIFSMESWNAWCSQAGLEKADRPRGPAPERLQSGAGGGPPGGRRGAGAALPGGGGDSPRRAGAAHRRHRPLPLALLANRLPAGGEPAGSRPVHRLAGGGDRPLAPADQRLAFGRRRQARPGGVLLGETPEIVPGGILIEAQRKLSGHRGNVLKYRRLGVFVVFP